MATYRPSVPADIKRILVDQAGGKCANPGCANRLLELHHIKEWHVYQTHDAEHMIALCAHCHDSVDRGDLRITDDELYAWKQIDRAKAQRVGGIYIEPGPLPRLLLGSISVAGAGNGLAVFDFADRHALSFTVKDQELMLLNLKISDSQGRLLVDAVDNYVRQRDESITLQMQRGRFRVDGTLHSPWIPDWVRVRLLAEDLAYGIDGMPLLDLQVIEPGVVRVRGCWVAQDGAGHNHGQAAVVCQE